MADVIMPSVTSGRVIDMGGLDGELGFALRLAQVAVFKDFTAMLKPLDLRPADFSALLLIEANAGLKQSTLAEALSIQGPNLVALIDQLQARGLIDRAVMPTDRRSHALLLTTPGRALLRRARRAHNAHLARLADCLQSDPAPLVAALHRVAGL